MEKHECKFYKTNGGTGGCDHRDNNDIQSRLQNGHLRRLPKRCEPRFCPYNKVKIEFETSKYCRKGGKKI